MSKSGDYSGEPRFDTQHNYVFCETVFEHLALLRSNIEAILYSEYCSAMSVPRSVT